MSIKRFLVAIAILTLSVTALFPRIIRVIGSADILGVAESIIAGGLPEVNPQPVFFGGGPGSTTGRISSLTLRDTNPAHSFGEVAFQDDTGNDVWHFIQDADFTDTQDLRIRRKGQEVLRFDPLSATGSDVLSTYKGTRWRFDRSGPSPVEFRDTSFALPNGLWRLVASGDSFLLNKNTAVAGDFSTSFDAIKADPSGKVTIGQGDLQANANLIIKGPSPWVDVRAFASGTSGFPDDGLDDVTAFTAAIDSLPAGGGTVLIPPGDFEICNWVITKGAVHVVGVGGMGWGFSGVGSPRLICSTAAATMLTLGSASSTEHRGAEIENLVFRDTSAGANTITNAIKILRMNHVTIRDCSFESIGGTGAAAIETDGTGDFTQYPRFFNVNIRTSSTGTNAMGVKLGVNTSGALFVGGHMAGPGNTSTGTGIFLDATSATMFVEGTALEAWGTHIDLSGNNSTVTARFENTGSTSGTGVSISGDNNVVQGGSFTSLATGISLSSTADRNQILGPNMTGSLTTHISDSGTATTIVKSGNTTTNSAQMMLRSNISAVAGQAGFILNQETSGGMYPAMYVTSGQGIVLKNDTSMAAAGGLWMSADQAARAGIGAGLCCGVPSAGASSVRGTSTEASWIRFLNGTIDFYSNTGITDGPAFSPTRRMSIAAGGGLTLDNGNFILSGAGATVDGKDLDNMADTTNTTATQADLVVGTCTLGTTRIDTGGATKEWCVCGTTNVWSCWNLTTGAFVTGAGAPAD